MVRRISHYCLLTLVCMACGCATIRKFSPLESHTIEARELTQLAESAIHNQKWADAESLLVTAIERCPDDNHARSVLARVLWERGAKKAAAEQMARSIQLSGRRDPYALTELGRMALEMGDYHTALGYANEAITQDGTQADAWTLRGFALKGNQQTEDALGAFYRSLSIRSDDPRTRLEIAKICRDSGDIQRALAILDPSLAQEEGCPQHADVCYLRGLLLRDLDRPTDAMVALREAKQSGHASPNLLYHLAEAELEAGEAVQARATLADAMQGSGPEYEVALRELMQRIDAEIAPAQPFLR